MASLNSHDELERQRIDELKRREIDELERWEIDELERWEIDELEQWEIKELYALLNVEETKDYLNDMEKRTTCHTPLHKAAAAGMSRWALEVANLKPSLARKLNHEGLSPMHLALCHGHVQTVRALMAFDSGLIQVKGRNLVTPLHYAAELEETELLAEFLLACPSSIQDLTSRCETAVHIAVHNERLNACKVLFGWIRRMDKEVKDILNWKDEDGNTVLHIATLTNQPEVMKLLIRHVKVNAKNFNGLTALDLYLSKGQLLDKEVKKILRGAKAKQASEFSDSLTSAGYLSRTSLSIIEQRDQRLGLTSAARRASYRNEIRNMSLVVAVLIATATYQGVLSPPGGYWQDDCTTPTAAAATATTASYAPAPGPAAPGAGCNVTGRPPHEAGKMIMSGSDLYFFIFYNSGAFAITMLAIAMALAGIHSVSMLTSSVSYVMINYIVALWSNVSNGWNFGLQGFAMLVLLGGFWIPRMIVGKEEKLKSRLDIPGRCIGGLL